MTKQEIEAFLQKPEVLEVIKDNLEMPDLTNCLLLYL